MKLQTLAVIGVAVLGAIVGRQLFPPRTPPAVVQIHTVRDTVKVVDTLTLSKIITKLKSDTVYLEHFSVTPPETVTVAPAVSGVKQLYVPQKVGDSTLATGFAIQPIPGSQYVEQNYGWKFYTPGPLAGLELHGDTLRLAFYQPPEKPCKFLCKTKLLGEGAIGGILFYVILHGVK